jgi:tetratricopeptide (TPR) repeat protein
VLDIIGKRKQSYNEISLEAYVDETAIYINLGNRYFKTKKLERAHNCFQKALERDKNNLLALTGSASCFLETEEFKKAQELFERVHQQAPNDLDTLEKLGWLAIKLQNFPKGIEVYEELLALEPKNLNILKRLAALYSKTGDIEKSKKYLLRLKSNSE